MSGKCIITIPQDNQCEPSNVSKNFTQHITCAETQQHGLIWIEKGSPELLLHFP